MIRLFNILDYSAQLAQRPVALRDCLDTLGNRGVRRTRAAVICKGKLSSAAEFAVGYFEAHRAGVLLQAGSQSSQKLCASLVASACM